MFTFTRNAEEMKRRADAFLSVATDEPQEIVTQEQLTAVLRRMECSALATLRSYRTVKNGELVKPKTNGTEGRISKASRCQVLLNVSYGNMVNNQRGRETAIGEFMEEFEPEPRKWGERLFGCTLVLHRDKYYLETMILRSFDVQWYLDGVPVDSATVKPFMHDKKRAATQKTAKEIMVRDWGMETIRQLDITPNAGGDVKTHHYTVE